MITKNPKIYIVSDWHDAIFEKDMALVSKTQYFDNLKYNQRQRICPNIAIGATPSKIKQKNPLRELISAKNTICIFIPTAIQGGDATILRLLIPIYNKIKIQLFVWDGKLLQTIENYYHAKIKRV